ncbi:helix-turn-helix domain-containing protein [Lachnospiraceae bacterium 62-26]|nr:regulatory protein PchR [Lachnospiraceae bacterium]
MDNKKTVGYTENFTYRCLEDHQQVNAMSIVSPLNLDYCGMEQCEPGHRFGPYVRENYVVHIILNGCGSLQIGEQEIRLSREEAFVICPGQEAVYEADGEEPWEYMWIGFHGYVAKKIVRFMGFTDECPVIRVRDTELLKAEVEKMLEARELTFVNMLKRSSALYAMLSMMIDEHPDGREIENPSNIAYVNKAVEIMTQSYAKKIKISDIATTIGISRNYLTDLFKHEFDMSPQNFLMSFRMEKAAQELVETDESVQTIGINVGYPDPLAFSKAFKQKYGMSPSAYRTSAVELIQCDTKGQYAKWYHL